MEDRMHPFQLLPEEVWDMIVEEYLDDVQDVKNLVEALPQLENIRTVRKKKPQWLFGQALSHLIPWNFTNYISGRDLLNCRQVCRRWSTDVDTFLESLPMDRAHHPSFQKLGKLSWKHIYPVNKTNDDDEEEDNNLKEAHPVGGTFFDGSYLNHRQLPWSLRKKQVSHFLKKMRNHPPERSPFLGRSLTMVYPRRYWSAPKKIKTGTTTLYEKFGRHVWHYRMDYCWEEGRPFPIKLIRDCLSQLPNLRSLKINLYGDTLSEQFVRKELPGFMVIMVETLPPLPQLESLGIETPFDGLGQCLIAQFSKQLRRLEMRAGSGSEYSQIFPELRELQVTIGNLSDINRVKGMLLRMEAPKLTKLQFVSDGRSLFDRRQWTEFNSASFLFEKDVFQWLKRFPNLECLNFGDRFPVGQVEERGTLQPDTDSSKSLKFLSVRTSPGMDYNFLRCLPSLQHLQLFVSSKLTHQDKEFAIVYPPKLWLQLPKLRRVTLHVESSPGRVEHKWVFSREEYEYRLRKNLQPLRVDSIAPCRSQSIAEFLLNEKRKTSKSVHLVGTSSAAKQFLNRLGTGQRDHLEKLDDLDCLEQKGEEDEVESEHEEESKDSSESSSSESSSSQESAEESEEEAIGGGENEEESDIGWDDHESGSDHYDDCAFLLSLRNFIRPKLPKRKCPN